jgi:deoxyribodipyrimidine photo-lyase
MSTAIVWFRRDLRLEDNPALAAALATAETVIPLYIDSPMEAGAWAPGAASNWWLHHSLAALDASLRQRGSRLVIRQGPAGEALQQLISECGASHVFWNRLYEPALIARDKQLKHRLQTQGLTSQSFNASLLFEPWQVLKDNGGPYRVFTPYWKQLQRRGLPLETLPSPGQLPPVPSAIASLPFSALHLLPTHHWADGFHAHWQPGEQGAQAQLDTFLGAVLPDYDHLRDLPGSAGSSRLSPHLHFGELSPRQVVAAIEQYCQRDTVSGLLHSAENYQRQLAWRDFASYLLYHFPHTPEEPFDTRFTRFPWEPDNRPRLQAWQQGRTGIPIVDAGMRELWQSGWMHNRVRMIVASLLSKNLLQHWLHGARWFWDTLVDADLAANTLSWQWTAGCGADAAPYFRVFNPVLQGQKFDPKGRYVRRWVPEISALPDKFLHRPWETPARVLEQAGIELGKDYPEPIVDLKLSRQEALQRFQQMKHARQ